MGTTALELFVAARDLYSVFVRTLYYVARGTREPTRDHAAGLRDGEPQRVLPHRHRWASSARSSSTKAASIEARRARLHAARRRNFLQLLVRDFAASIGALMLSTRIGAGIAAELGSMVVTEQVDALRMCAADPIDFLVAPRFVAGVVMTGFLVVLGGAVTFFAGALTAHLAFEVPYSTFITAHAVRLGDLLTGIAKCIAYGAAIPIVSSHSGLSTFGGSEGVGWATTRAVVNSSLAIIMLNFFISGAALLVFPP
ncbi:MAG: ABC transporter permease [Polyangiaceae bacterium]